MFVTNGEIDALIQAYVMNCDKYDAMSPEKQQILLDVVTAAHDHMQQNAIENCHLWSIRCARLATSYRWLTGRRNL